MTLRKKTLAILALTLTGLVAALYALSQVIVLSSFAQQEEQDVRQNVERIRGALYQDLEALSHLARDWAVWDDSYRFVQDRNAEFIMSNLETGSSFANNRVNIMAFVSTSGEVVFAKAVDLAAGKETSLPSGLQRHFAPGGPVLKVLESGEGISGILSLDGTPTLLAAEPIVTSEGEGPIAGVLIFARRLDTNEIGRLARTTMFSLEGYGVGDPSMPADFTLATASLTEASPIHLRPVNDSTINGYTLFTDFYGEPSLLLKVDMPRTVYAKGQYTVFYLIMGLLAVALVFGAVMLLLIEKLMLTRVLRLSANVSTIGAAGDLSQRVPVEGSSDELAHLGTQINDMLGALERSQIERRAGENKYQLLMEQAADGIVITDRNGDLVEVNSTACKSLGYTRDELLKLNARDIFVSDGVARPSLHYRRMLGGQTVLTERIMLAKDGTTFPVEISAKMLEDGNIQAIAREITVRKQAEAALRHRVQFERLITSISTNFINIAPSEIDAEINRALEAVGSFAGVDRSYVFSFHDNLALMDNTHEWCAEGVSPQKEDLQRIPTAEFPWMMEKFQAAENVHIPLVADLPAEAEREKAEFSRLDIQSLLLVPMIYGKSPVGFVGFDSVHEPMEWPVESISLLKIVGDIFVNALERKRVEEALRESEERYRLLFERNLAGVYRTTPEGLMLDCNEALTRILGYERREDLLSRNVTDFYIDPADRKDSMRLLEEQGTFTDMEMRLRKPDGSLVWVLDSGSVIHTDKQHRITFEGTIIDITARKQMEEALRESEKQFRAVFENAMDAMLILDEEGCCVDVNPAACALATRSREQMVGLNIIELVPPDRRHDTGYLAQRLYHSGENRGEFQIMRLDGETREIEFATKAHFLRGYHLLVMRDISERKALQEELAHQAFHDSLTSLPNRTLFMDRLGLALARAGRGGGAVALLFLDLDDFKVINDSLGHKAGDQLLISVGDRLNACVRPGDSVARLGGDEFTILLEGFEDQAAVTDVADRIAEELGAPFYLEGHDVFVQASMGIAITDEGEGPLAGPEELLRNADTAMYEAKNRGKARYMVFDPSMNSRAWERLQMETDLRRAVERQEFEVYYQPVVDLTSGRIVEMEALVRWRHPQRGLVTPSEFISLAEDTGMILPLGRWVLEEACRRANEWQRFSPEGESLTVSVNLSARQFSHADVILDISRALTLTGLDPCCLKLEITESIAVEDAENTVATLSALKRLGVRLAIDDFGTGYSALSYLKRYSVDALKLDRSFIRGLGQEAEDTAMVRAVIAFAQALDLNVTAEGIETPEQLEYLRLMGCDWGQGYLFSRALPHGEMEALLAAPAVILFTGKPTQDKAEVALV